MLSKSSTSFSPASFVERDDISVSSFMTGSMMLSSTISFIDNKMEEYDGSDPVSDKDDAQTIKTVDSCPKQEDETNVSSSFTRKTRKRGE